jgi:ubiquinone/menaquinone biosynthesis C-methylase UbiE
MKKSYEGHEIQYQKMKKKRILFWDQMIGHNKEITSDTKRFLIDVLAQPWAPKGGKVIELGCGTAPILRWLCKKKFKGLGVDVSKTAIKMAREQSQNLDIRFKQADVCNLIAEKSGTFDLAVDGHCLHCIIQPKDRKSFLDKTFRLLKEGGLFVVMTMCAPVDRKMFSNLFPEQKLVDRVIYVPYDKATEYDGSRTFEGRDYIPTRYIGHWESILTELRRAGFRPRLIRYSHPVPQVPFSNLAVGALSVATKSPVTQVAF